MNLLKTFAKKKSNSGVLTGKLLNVDAFQLKVEALIGEGGYASIYRVVELRSRETFALKHFRSG